MMFNDFLEGYWFVYDHNAMENLMRKFILEHIDIFKKLIWSCFFVTTSLEPVLKRTQSTVPIQFFAVC